MDEKITWIKSWVYTGGDTPFNEIWQLMYHATTQANLGQCPDNVLWDEHDSEPLLCVDGLKVKWSQWNGLYKALISRIQCELEDITFLMPLSLPPSHVYIENHNDSHTGVKFATTLPKEQHSVVTNSGSENWWRTRREHRWSPGGGGAQTQVTDLVTTRSRQVKMSPALWPQAGSQSGDLVLPVIRAGE